MQGFVIAAHVMRSFQTKKFPIVVDDKRYSQGAAGIGTEVLHKLDPPFLEKE